MRFGVCASVEHAAKLAEMGYDYFEINATSLAAMDAAEFSDFLAQNRAAPIRAEAANCLFPGALKLTGDAVDEDAVRAHLALVMERLGKTGVKVVSFGSGGSRAVPDGFSREKAWEQLIFAGRIMADIAEANGVTVALEPLRRAESNIINSLSEGAALVQAVDHPSFRLLCDYYHLILEGETEKDVERHGALLAHVHIANPAGRVPMAQGDAADYGAFFAALCRAGYDGRVSFEGETDFAKLPGALDVMRRAAGQA